ncbi:MAG: tRNA dihydrouridine synthase DusB [Myxococcales bacterium]|nr:tRNA dihydrouridine synthase DusB [Myxococcales bacterium]
MTAPPRSSPNEGVPPAGADEFAPLRIGGLEAWPPVVLAPMAGVTNWPFRELCRRYGAGLTISEMITARPLVEGRDKTLRLADFGPEESPRSLQLYGVDPHFVGLAVRRLVDEGRVDHIDMNFGCPVRKVTRKGGGAAIPAKPNLLRAIVRAAVQNAGSIPVTIKVRMGIDEDWLTYLEAGQIAEAEGCAAIALHARTAAQLYDGQAQWEAIARLKQHVRSIPVLGNGDIWEAWDALRMMRETGCDGVVIGRGCLGRPWLFRELAAIFEGREPAPPPRLGEIAEIALEHAGMLCAWMGEGAAMRAFRRQAAWYTKGFRGSASLRRQLMRVERLDGLRAVLTSADPAEPFPEAALRVSRAKGAGRQRVALPEGFRDDLEDATPPPGAAGECVSGG